MARSALLVIASLLPAAVADGVYVINATETAQVMKGLGYEIQSDSIGSGNHGLPTSNTSVPNDLVESEKTRFFSEMLGGFRYCRLALGLYFRGLNSAQDQFVERWPGQAAGLAAMAAAAGIEGFDVEYWSPAPAWKTNGALINGHLAGTNASFLTAFATAVVNDLNYLSAAGIQPVQFGLQNEPPVGEADDCIYSCCGYNSTTYAAAFAAVAPAVRSAYPNVTIHANSWGGPSDASAALILADPTAAACLDGWTWHCVGCNSNEQLGSAATHFMAGAANRSVWNNEFEYLSTPSSPTYALMNTAQSIMNWFAFTDAPTWFWLHALKPTYNSESTGYGLGFWRPWDDNNFNVTHFPDVPYGHWTWNPQNWHSLAPFVKHMPWDVPRVVVNESVTDPDARILAFAWNAPLMDAHLARTRVHARAYTARQRDAGATMLGMVMTNRHNASDFTFAITLTEASASDLPAFAGYAFNLTDADVYLGIVNATLTPSGAVQVNITLPPNHIHVWMQV